MQNSTNYSISLIHEIFVLFWWVHVYSESIETYTKEIRKLCEKLMRCIAMSLGLRAERFKEMFGEAVQAIRMNYYPPCPRPDLVLGLSPHSDGSALTILQQKQGSSVGLQVLKDNKWVSIQPIPNALVVNVGDTLEVILSLFPFSSLILKKPSSYNFFAKFFL